MYVETCPTISIGDLQRNISFQAQANSTLNWRFTSRSAVWRITIKVGFEGNAGSVFFFDTTGWSCHLMMVRREDTRRRRRWFFQSGGETFQKAYFAHGRFGSRKALGLTYQQETLSRSQRQWEKLMDEEMRLRAAEDRGELSDEETDRLDAVISFREASMGLFALKQQAPKFNKQARRARFESEVEATLTRLSQRDRVNPPLDDLTIDGVVAEMKAAAPPLCEPLEWSPKTDHGFSGQDRPHLNIAVLARLKMMIEGKRNTVHVGWGPDWNPDPKVDIDLIVDLTDPGSHRRRPDSEDGKPDQISALLDCGSGWRFWPPSTPLRSTRKRIGFQNPLFREGAFLRQGRRLSVAFGATDYRAKMGFQLEGEGGIIQKFEPSGQFSPQCFWAFSDGPDSRSKFPHIRQVA